MNIWRKNSQFLWTK